ncbi:tRNA pseudouridine(55) synthase TruB [candidate division WOR-3 bacterium]|nr:tRNA pseudouridine(55) synthase TruB [candidate division WOR-3 bacterium]
MTSPHQTTESQHNTPSNIKDGVLLVNKSPGEGSTFVLNRVKRALKLKHAGHGGTLDPFAEGLLLILIGKATKLMDYYGNKKEYISQLRLGVSTTTDDPEGEVISEKDISGINETKIKEVLKNFEGKIIQKVPLYSAVKINGKRLYKIARMGGSVTLPKREVIIEKIELLDFSPPFLSIRTVVQRGVYLRALARDIGKLLGCGAYLYQLKRTYVEPFSIENAYTLDSIKAGNFHIILLKDTLPHLPVVTLMGENVYRFRHGGTIRGYYPEGLYFVKDKLDNPLGIGVGDTYILKPRKVFNEGV